MIKVDDIKNADRDKLFAIEQELKKERKRIEANYQKEKREYNKLGKEINKKWAEENKNDGRLKDFFDILKDVLGG